MLGGQTPNLAPVPPGAFCFSTEMPPGWTVEMPPPLLALKI
jgi:hypothetical protein